MAEVISGIPADWQTRVASLNTTNDEVREIGKRIAESGSPAQMADYQRGLGQRNSAAEMVSSVYRALTDTIRSIIQNLR